MKRRLGVPALAVLGACLAGCVDYGYREAAYDLEVEPGTVLGLLKLDRDLEEKILALNPERICEADIKQVLSRGPAPRIINVHGGTILVSLQMKSFAEYLTGMGYPEAKIRHPRYGYHSHSCYESSKKLAGIVAWYYEKEGMRPMIVGHSQGGIQAVRALHELAGSYGNGLPVWNPVTDRCEKRDTIVDPLTGETRPTVGLKMSYATAVGAGGLTRLLPHQLSMLGKLRRIPDSVVEFTGFYISPDILGADLFGLGHTNMYQANGTAKVRTVRLPFGHDHYFVPSTKHLAQHQETRDWINRYTQSDEPEHPGTLKGSTSNIVWGADVWTSVKRHWCLEVQRLIRARRKLQSGPRCPDT